MKVNYKKTIVEKINDVIKEAESLGKEIENIAVTEEEINELYEDYDLPIFKYLMTPWETLKFEGAFNYKGTKLIPDTQEEK